MIKKVWAVVKASRGTFASLVEVSTYEEEDDALIEAERLNTEKPGSNYFVVEKDNE